MLLVPAGTTAAEPPLAPWKDNSRFWSYHGKPVLLRSGNEDDNL
jgi:hypothetical protein